MAKKIVDNEDGGNGGYTFNRVVKVIKETKVGTRIAIAVMVMVLIAAITS